MSEDCLFLNIDVSAKLLRDNKDISGTKSVPVVVFVHGGSYVRGAGLVYRGTDAIEFWQEQAIVITMEYRLFNVFGFVGSEELRTRKILRAEVPVTTACKINAWLNSGCRLLLPLLEVTLPE